MKYTLKNYRILLSLLVLCCTTVGTGALGGQRAVAITVPPPTIIAAKCSAGFFGLEPWYRFMPNELGVPKRGDQPADPCGVRCFNIFPQTEANVCGEKASDIPGVILAIIDNLLRIVGLVAVAFVLKGAFEYIGSRGNAEKTAAAQSTIISALIGLAIALIAVALIAFIGNNLIG